MSAKDMNETPVSELRELTVYFEERARDGGICNYRVHKDAVDSMVQICLAHYRHNQPGFHPRYITVGEPTWSEPHWRAPDDAGSHNGAVLVFTANVRTIWQKD